MLYNFWYFVLIFLPIFSFKLNDLHVLRPYGVLEDEQFVSSFNRVYQNYPQPYALGEKPKTLKRLKDITRQITKFKDYSCNQASEWRQHIVHITNAIAKYEDERGIWRDTYGPIIVHYWTAQYLKRRFDQQCLILNERISDFKNNPRMSIIQRVWDAVYKVHKLTTVPSSDVILRFMISSQAAVNTGSVPDIGWVLYGSDPKFLAERHAIYQLMSDMQQDAQTEQAFNREYDKQKRNWQLRYDISTHKMANEYNAHDEL